jgi:hypothetical protein
MIHISDSIKELKKIRRILKLASYFPITMDLSTYDGFRKLTKDYRKRALY